MSQLDCIKKKIQMGVFAHLEKCHDLNGSQITHSVNHGYKNPQDFAGFKYTLNGQNG
jgi:hypothetical protein